MRLSGWFAALGIVLAACSQPARAPVVVAAVPPRFGSLRVHLDASIDMLGTGRDTGALAARLRLEIEAALDRAGYRLVPAGAGHDLALHLTTQMRKGKAFAEGRMYDFVEHAWLQLRRGEEPLGIVVETEEDSVENMAGRLVNALSVQKVVAELATTAMELRVSKVFVMDLKPAAGAPDGVAQRFSHALLLALGELEMPALGMDDLRRALELEKLKDLLDCNSTVCLSEIGGALGARYVTYGTVSGESGELCVDLTVLDANDLTVVLRDSVRLIGVDATEPAQEFAARLADHLLTHAEGGESKPP